MKLAEKVKTKEVVFIFVFLPLCVGLPTRKVKVAVSLWRVCLPKNLLPAAPCCGASCFGFWVKCNNHQGQSNRIKQGMQGKETG